MKINEIAKNLANTSEKLSFSSFMSIYFLPNGKCYWWNRFHNIEIQISSQLIDQLNGQSSL